MSNNAIEVTRITDNPVIKNGVWQLDGDEYIPLEDYLTVKKDRDIWKKRYEELKGKNNG